MDGGQVVLPFANKKVCTLFLLHTYKYIFYNGVYCMFAYHLNFVVPPLATTFIYAVLLPFMGSPQALDNTSYKLYKSCCKVGNAGAVLCLRVKNILVIVLY